MELHICCLSKEPSFIWELNELKDLTIDEVDYEGFSH